MAHILHKLGSDHTIPITSVVKFYGNLMSASDDELMNTLLDLKILDKMPYMIEKLKEDRLQEISWMLSNITAGTPEQIEYFLKQEKLLEQVFAWARESKKQALRVESTYVIANALSGGTLEHIDFLLNRGALEILVKNLAF